MLFKSIAELILKLMQRHSYNLLNGGREGAEVFGKVANKNRRVEGHYKGKDRSKTGISNSFLQWQLLLMLKRQFF